jgi:hypothetical protein
MVVGVELMVGLQRLHPRLRLRLHLPRRLVLWRRRPHHRLRLRLVRRRPMLVTVLVMVVGLVAGDLAVVGVCVGGGVVGRCEGGGEVVHCPDVDLHGLKCKLCL